jgi:NAD(P) transhydrogenase subunit alpha
LLNFVSLIVDKKTGVLALNWDDEIVRGAGLTRDGTIVNPAVKG